MSTPVVVITGASSGIGRATAQAFARSGAQLVLAARSEESLQDVAEECAALGAIALPVPTDVTDTAQVEGLVGAAVDRFGRIDVWVGAAGVFGYGGVLEMPEEVFARILDINLMGQVRGVRAVLPEMLHSGRGTIILIGSMFSTLSAPYVPAYVTSKHGLRGFADSVRQELRGTPVRLSLVMPATMDTPIYEHAPNFTGRETRQLPLVSDAHRVADAIVCLARAPRRETTVGIVQGLMIPLRALAGGVYDAIITTLVRRSGFGDGVVEPKVGTIYQPDPASNAISGGWDRVGNPHSEYPASGRASTSEFQRSE